MLRHSKSTRKIQAPRIKDAATGELFLVATPIGHLKDITLRAIAVLQTVDLIACEDTRTSSVLLRHYGIATKCIAHHAHNEAESTAVLVEKLRSGKRIALISDAGTPLVSDPGGRLVEAAIAAGIRVTPIPGASAMLAALCIAGLPALPFYFGGFLPTKSKQRQAVFKALQTLPATLVFYESPKRLVDSLADAATVFGERQAAVARELTKLHEECRRETLSVLCDFYAHHPPRGECVLLIAGASDAAPSSVEDADILLQRLLRSHSVKESAALAAEQTGLSKRDLYQRALELRG